ncbi:MAG: hypothetical protein AMXMBFR58_32700 [Phycisphaerae bacterium]
MEAMRRAGAMAVMLGMVLCIEPAPAGPIDPPPGPIAPTMKPLSDVEPRVAINAENTPGDANSVFRISKSGSYYLTSDVEVVALRSGIEIDHSTATEVTIDLNGFTLRGKPGSKHAVVSSGFGHVHLLNGNVTGFGDIAVLLDCREYRIERISVSSCDNAGLYVSAAGVISDCVVTDCADVAIRTLGPAVIDRCMVWGGGYGIWCADGSTVTGCSALATKGSGFVASKSTLRDCVGSYNDNFGFELGDSNTVSNCIADGNKIDGIGGGTGCTIENSTASGNYRHGIFMGDYAVLRGCLTVLNGDSGTLLNWSSLAENCTSSGNVSHGFGASQRATFVNCRASECGGDGFSAGLFAVLKGCTGSNNTGRGVNADVDLSAIDCRFDSNGSDGLRATSRATIDTCGASFNGGDGFEVADGCSLRSCTANDNVLRGFNANNGCQITGCLTRNNKLDGIYVNYSCEVSNNNCNGDGAAAGNQGAIRVVGQANRIDSNNISYADRGIFVELGGNIVVRNTVKGCTLNYSIVAGNTDAQVLTPGSAFVATNPWANFSY